MDAFFASVEILDFPELKGKPVVVGGSSNRGVVAAASYRAREYGIHSAMPIFQAKRLCPDLVIRPGRMRRYAELSARVMRSLYGFSPVVQQISIDEAYIDLSGTEKLLGAPEGTVRRIQERILEETSLTSSIGLSVSKLIAKIASDYNKPSGITVVPPEAAQRFLDGLPVGRVPGIGKKSEEELRKIGISKLGDIGRLSPGYLEERFGRFGERLLEICRGEGGGEVMPYSSPKSVSNEITLAEDTDDYDLLEKHLLALSENVGGRLRKQELQGRTVTLKLKDSKHRQITRSVTLERPTHQGKVIYRESRGLLRKHGGGSKKRLIGVGVSNLENAGTNGHPRLFGGDSPDEEKWERIDRAVDDIIERFGRDAVKRGRLNE